VVVLDLAGFLVVLVVGLLRHRPILRCAAVRVALQ
jgi:hypothetical protein